MTGLLPRPYGFASRWSGLAVTLILFVFLIAAAQGICAADVRRFGAQGDGRTDDTEAIRRAIGESNGAVVFAGGRFRISETIEIPLAESGPISLDGQAGTGTVVMAGPGPAFRFLGTHRGTSGPDTVSDHVSRLERMPTVQNLVIEGAHPEADGLEFLDTLQPVVRGAMIRRMRHGIILRQRSRNFILDASHLYDCSGVGLLLDQVDLHQAIVQGSHISFCRQGGIRSIASSIRNLQITGNDIEYNYDRNAEESADIWIDSRQGSVREGTIASNTIQSVPTDGGANIRWIGNPDTENKVGLWSITGNHISNQTINIHITSGRGFTITGNSFIRGNDRNLLLEDSRHVVFAANSIDNNPDYREAAGNGITIRRCRGVILSAVQLQVAGPVEGRRAAVEIIESREVTLTSSQLFDAVPDGVFVSHSRNVQIEQCMIQQDDADGDDSTMAAAIRVDHGCQGVVIRNNLVSSGIEGDIITAPETSHVEGNRSLQ
ncbi:MAG: hypothetical protein EA424_12565 [Planctomycetaceae bacterium]|nr:MAG: hypothetical protein EA424_12565 [Planctomycetaceae bacterium]